MHFTLHKWNAILTDIQIFEDIFKLLNMLVQQ